MADPSQNIHHDLLPHIHLLSTYRYPSKPRIEFTEAIKYLLAAPKISRSTAPFFWTYLDAPQDGTILLTWQPTQRRQAEFSSDGYIWAGPEVVYRQEAGNGFILEIYYHKVGFRYGENLATHSRRRFRLVPAQVAMPNMPDSVDPNLWIVHYGPSDKSDVIPANMVPMNQQMQQMLSFRQYLFQMGQITRKEFMLGDRVNWPQIPLPSRSQSVYAAPQNARGIPQSMAYPPNGGVPTPKRRPPHPAPAPALGHAPMMGAAVLESVYDDDEDTSRGDIFDHLTAREVSLARFQQNHEWMEEIISSPYRMGQIIAPDLGLGLKGELASLTEGIFTAPGADALTQRPDKPYTGRLDPALAKEFKERMEKKAAATAAEIAEIKAKHGEAMAKFKGNATIKYAEHELRDAIPDGSTGIWRAPDRRRAESEEEDAPPPPPKHHKKVEDIVAQIESSTGKKVHVVQDVHRVAAGGYLEPQPEPEPEPQLPEEPAESSSAAPNPEMSRQPSHAGSQNSGVMVGYSDIDMGGTAAGMLDQMHTGFSSTSTPINNFPTPQPQLSAIPSAAATPAIVSVPSPQPASQAPAQPTAPSASEDVKMDDADASKAPSTASDQGTGTDDWVVVPKGGESSGTAAATAGADAAPEAPATSSVPAPPVPAPTSKPSSAAPTPGDGLGFDSNDFSSLGDLDTAGDAMAGYDPPSIGATGGDLGDLNMDLDDSAFGDALHGVDLSGSGAPYTPAEGM